MQQALHISEILTSNFDMRGAAIDCSGYLLMCVIARSLIRVPINIMP